MKSYSWHTANNFEIVLYLPQYKMTSLHHLQFHENMYLHRTCSTLINSLHDYKATPNFLADKLGNNPCSISR